MIDKKDVMMERIMSGLREGYILDLKKPEFDYFERAAIIRQLLDSKGWSIRQMAAEFKIPKSTIEDWLLYDRITEKKYQELLSKGMVHTEIYRTLRERKAEPTKHIPIEVVDKELIDMRQSVKKMQTRSTYTTHTESLIDDLQKELNRLCSIVIAEMKQVKKNETT